LSKCIEFDENSWELIGREKPHIYIFFRKASKAALRCQAKCPQVENICGLCLPAISSTADMAKSMNFFP
jgi:hypothetical protein